LTILLEREIFESMTAMTLELQNTLIHKIQSIEDMEILKALNVLIDTSYARSVVYELSDEEEDSIRMGEQDISQGKFYTHEEVLSLEAQWLKE